MQTTGCKHVALPDKSIFSPHPAKSHRVNKALNASHYACHRSRRLSHLYLSLSLFPGALSTNRGQLSEPRHSVREIAEMKQCSLSRARRFTATTAGWNLHNEQIQEDPRAEQTRVSVRRGYGVLTVLTSRERVIAA